MFGIRRRHSVGAALAVMLLLPTLAVAAGIPTQIVPATCHGPDCTCGDLVELGQNILNTGIFLAVFLSAVLFAWAGWQMLVGKTAGESGKIDQAKHVLWNVMIGLVIILAAWLIVNTIMQSLTTLSVWNSICPTR